MSNDHYELHGFPSIQLDSYRKFSVTFVGLWCVHTDGSIKPPGWVTRVLLWLHPFYEFKWED
jgi:hypothetical protein